MKFLEKVNLKDLRPEHFLAVLEKVLDDQKFYDTLERRFYKHKMSILTAIEVVRKAKDLNMTPHLKAFITECEKFDTSMLVEYINKACAEEAGKELEYEEYLRNKYPENYESDEDLIADELFNNKVLAEVEIEDEYLNQENTTNAVRGLMMGGYLMPETK